MVPLDPRFPARQGARNPGTPERINPYAATTTAEFLQAMREYRTRAGTPTFEEMEYRSGGVCTAQRFRSTLDGKAMPTIALVGAFITACGGDADACGEWTAALRYLKDRITS
ncbi:hypothetical protein [Nocardiopsis chromatogenes]|uniref:hypothetical protein n=1 Tax=Nocardiopsis chromatogenes TaxID=280239 RepID=UPI000374C2FD|nr:hypothetical protein [Nocardiopsis chromatogenes]